MTTVSTNIWPKNPMWQVWDPAEADFQEALVEENFLCGEIVAASDNTEETLNVMKLIVTAAAHDLHALKKCN